MAEMKLILSLMEAMALSCAANAQRASITGKIVSDGKPLVFASVGITGTGFGATTDSSGFYITKNIPEGNYLLRASSIGFNDFKKQITIKSGENILLNVTLTANTSTLNEVVVTGVSKA